MIIYLCMSCILRSFILHTACISLRFTSFMIWVGFFGAWVGRILTDLTRSHSLVFGLSTIFIFFGRFGRITSQGREHYGPVRYERLLWYSLKWARQNIHLIKSLHIMKSITQLQSVQAVIYLGIYRSSFNSLIWCHCRFNVHCNTG